MARTKRFQNQITAGRLTLPVTILISVFCWILVAVLLPQPNVQQHHYPLWETFGNLCIPPWANHAISFLSYSIIGYLLIELNNTFSIIRMRASIQTAVYFLLVAICPSIQSLHAGSLATVAFLFALFFLFKSYQQVRPAANVFHAFIFIGIGSLLFPQLMLFIPVFWIGAYNFQSLQPKSFFASLVGWSVPYWFLLAHAFYQEEMELFYQPFRTLATFTPIRFDFQPWEMATIGYLFVLFTVSTGHCLTAGYEDKIRTRSYLHFLIFLDLCIFICMGLQPAWGIRLLPVLLVGVSILSGHLFALTNSRTSNIFFICTLILLFLLFGFNIWTLL